MSEESQYQLQWRGKSHGPWSYAEIQKQLQEGEIHSLYQIRVEGSWITLREHIEKVEGAELQRRAAELGASIRKKESEKVEPVVPVKRGRGRIESPVSRPNPFANPPPVFVKSASSNLEPTFNYGSSDSAPTCWLAVAAFVVSCCSFVPYLNLVSWLPSIVLGHLALAQIRRDPSLEGRGLAIGALLIAYAMLALAALSFLFLPTLFYRVFPIAG